MIMLLLLENHTDTKQKVKINGEVKVMIPDSAKFLPIDTVIEPVDESEISVQVHLTNSLGMF